MADVQSALTLDCSRGWTRLREIGSPLRLARLVNELSSADRRRGHHLANHADQAGRQTELAAWREHARTYCGLLSMRQVAAHYASRMGLSAERYGPLGDLDRSIGTHKPTRLDHPEIDAAPGDFTSRVMLGRCIELERQLYRDDLYDPGEINLVLEAYEVFRRGTFMAERGNNEEAERMYLRAIAAEPKFSLALRSYADVLRRRDSRRASAFYLEALQHHPRPDYGVAAPSMADVIAIHRNFVIARLGNDYLAYPAAVGPVDLLSPVLRTRSRRFAGLLLMRLRLRVRPQGPAFDLIGPEALLRTYIPAKGHERDETGLGAPAAAARRGENRIRRLMSAARSLVRSGARLSLGLLTLNIHRFHFVLADSSREDLERQIDRIDDLWLSRTASR